ncbi:transporter substrate-binding domain-containing protein [uncultured Pseudoteredinibacter sp.]|uniref:substrate-binding periplasmic protein n=1 Tax=uncultured Pseudoteredinibacter sp. TaxID=1641701 RepID=UPI00261DA539|nr:transporter substrate-binding domain-containing protein [uncultured Pseudoteredinibacter sp.]
MSHISFADSQDLSIVTTDEDYPPYTYTDKNGKAAGLYIELAKQVSLSLGIEASFHALPWRRATALARQGKIDILLIAYDNVENRRSFWIIPGNELGETTYTVCTVKEHPAIDKYKKISELPKQLIINTVNGYDYAFAIEQNIELNTQAIGRSEPHLISLLLGRRLEAILIEQSTLENHPRKKELCCLNEKIIGATEFIAFSKAATSRQQAENFSSAMRKFKQSPEFKELLEKYQLSGL